MRRGKYAGLAADVPCRLRTSPPRPLSSISAFKLHHSTRLDPWSSAHIDKRIEVLFCCQYLVLFSSLEKPAFGSEQGEQQNDFPPY